MENPEFFPFRPQDHGWVLRKDAEDAKVAEAYRQLVYELVTGDYAEGSAASRMRDEAVKMIAARSERAKAAAAARWGSPAENIPLPKKKQEVIDFALDNGLDMADVEQWISMSLKERKGKDKNGNAIRNWKGALVKFCKSMNDKRANSC